MHGWLEARRDRFRAQESAGPLLALALVCAAFTYDWVFRAEGGAVTCPLNALTGVPCPTCGMTRSFVALGDGLFAASFAAHAVGPLWFTLFAVVGVRWLVSVVRNRRPARSVALRVVAWGALGWTLAFGVWRWIAG